MGETPLYAKNVNEALARAFSSLSRVIRLARISGLITDKIKQEF